MAIGIALVCLPQVSMGIDLHDAKIGIPMGMGTDGTECAGMFSGEGNEKPAGSHMRTHEGFDGIEPLKRYSTASMGPCQGKMCGQTVTELCARFTESLPSQRSTL